METNISCVLKGKKPEEMNMDDIVKKLHDDASERPDGVARFRIVINPADMRVLYDICSDYDAAIRMYADGQDAIDEKPQLTLYVPSRSRR